MTSVDIPTGFLKSCRKHEEYPLKLVAREHYGRTILELAQTRFKKQRERLNLFVPQGKATVPFRTIARDGTVARGRLDSEDALGDWLGDAYAETSDAQTEASGEKSDPNDLTKVSAAKEDPACRFIFLFANGTTQPIQIAPTGLLRILTYFQVTPSFLDYLYVFGGKYGEDRERRFSAFRSENETLAPHADMRIPALNRSGKRFQICYNLKTINLKSEDDVEKANPEQTWKIRQAAIHHQLDVEAVTQLWIVAEPLKAFRDVIRDQFHEQRNHRDKFASFAQSFKTSLDMHLACGRWANEDWRWYIHYLERMVDEMTRQVIMRNRALIAWKSGLLGRVQDYEEKAIEVIMALESNLEITIQLQRFYNNLVDSGIPKSERCAARDIVRQFTDKADELASDLRTQISRVRVLEKNVANRKSILIQHLQGQAADRAERVADMMQDQAERSVFEAIAVRIITVITLLYLPGTFVGTIFSTDIVKYETPDKTGEERLSSVALWRYFQVYGPLMAVTVVGAVVWYFWEKRKIQHRIKEQKGSIEYDMV